MQDAFALYTDVKQKGPFSKTRFLSHYVEGPLSYCICNSHFCFCYACIHAAFFIVIRISLVGGGGGFQFPHTLCKKPCYCMYSTV